MSDKLPKSNNTDEVDLGKVFSYIEKLFIKIGQIFAGLFAFLGSILKNLGVFYRRSHGWRATRRLAARWRTTDIR